VLPSIGKRKKEKEMFNLGITEGIAEKRAK